MPAKSKAQQKAAGAALAAKRGDSKVGKLKGASRQMYESMTEDQLDEFASTRRKGKPEHAADAPAKKKSAAKKSGARALKARPRSTTKSAAKKSVKKASRKKAAKARRAN